MDAEIAKVELMRGVKSQIDSAAERFARAKLHQIIPDSYFAAASAECVYTFAWGEFYSCITLCQSVAEGLARFIAAKNNLPIRSNHLAVANSLQKSSIISKEVYVAFRRIRGKPKEDRNDYHHLTETIEQDYIKLESRAEECVAALYQIESEVFAYTFDNGYIVPKNLRYWPQGSQLGELQIYMRSGH